MASASRAQIAMRGDTPTDASASMTNWNLQMMAEVSEHSRGGCDQRRLEAAIREDAHLDADRAAIGGRCKRPARGAITLHSMPAGLSAYEPA
jgi:hypothetical protein